MSDYFVQWGHTYVMHFGAWVSLMFTVQIHKVGILPASSIRTYLGRALVLAAVLSVFSSHSHNHYLQHMSPKHSSESK